MESLAFGVNKLRSILLERLSLFIAIVADWRIDAVVFLLRMLQAPAIDLFGIEAPICANSEPRQILVAQ